MPDKETRTEPPVPASDGVAPDNPTEARRPILADASPAKSEGEPKSKGFADLTMKTTPAPATILHPEEIFEDAGSNTPKKKQAFNHYNNAVHAVLKAEGDLANASNERKRAAAEKKLEAARKTKAEALDKLKSVVVELRIAESDAVQAQRAEIKVAMKQHASAKHLAALREALAAYVAKVRPQVAQQVDTMTHGEAGQEGVSVFEPINTETHTFEVTFPGGETERLQDRRVAYATTAPEGVEGVKSKAERKADRRDVAATMAASDLSASKRRILATISGFEGGFDTVNTYDKKRVTWGYVQWAGGTRSDLTAAMTFIKTNYPDAFKDLVQRFGIDVDVVQKMLVVKRAEGEALKGEAAAKAIQEDPKLAAVLVHAGKDPNIKKGQVGAAASLEIDRAMDEAFKAGKHNVALDQLFTSEYAVGLLANTAVHSGGPTAKTIVGAALASYAKAHPYEAGEGWLAGAEAACIVALAAKDPDRAVTLGKLDHSRGSYKASDTPTDKR